MTNEEFDKAVWRKGDKVRITDAKSSGLPFAVTAISFDTRMISALITFDMIRHFHCSRCERVEDRKPIEQLPEVKVNELINKSMWDNEFPNPEQK